jgi:arylsulfatase
MSRVRALGRIGGHFAALIAACAPFVACESAPPEPNVVLITIDTLRADFLGSYGFPGDTSPRIDALAAQGVLFERALAASSTTSPSHASILTSRYTREHSIGFYSGFTVLDGLTTLPEWFQRAGYETAAFVGNINLEKRLGFHRGFDHYDDELPDAERNRPLQYERIAERTHERIARWLAVPHEEPFFLWAHYQDPHGPYEAPAGWAGRFSVSPEAGEMPLPLLDDNYGNGGIPRYQALPGLVRPHEYRSRYADEVFYADAYVGRLLDLLDAREDGRAAIVLLTADHGEFMGEDDVWFVHTAVSTPPLAHVPMILRAPGLIPERRSDPVSHVDVLPTLLELAGLPMPDDARGIALGPFLRSGEPLPMRLVYSDAGHELSAYRSDGFVRAVDLKEAWIRPKPPLEPAWAAYTWKRDGSFEKISDAEREDRRILSDYREIERYYGDAVPMVRAPEPDEEHVERLRTLGYVE